MESPSSRPEGLEPNRKNQSEGKFPQPGLRREPIPSHPIFFSPPPRIRGIGRGPGSLCLLMLFESCLVQYLYCLDVVISFHILLQFAFGQCEETLTTNVDTQASTNQTFLNTTKKAQYTICDEGIQKPRKSVTELHF